MCDEYQACGAGSGGSPGDQLYLLEVLVDRINLRKEKRKPGKFKVKVHFWDFPAIEIDECEFRAPDTPPKPPPQKPPPCIRPIKKPKKPPEGPPPPELVDPADLQDAPPDECLDDKATTGRVQPPAKSSTGSAKKDAEGEGAAELQEADELIDPRDLPPPEAIHKPQEEQPLPIKTQDTDQPFSSGKSCLFPMVPIDLIRGIQRSPISVYVFKQEEGEQPSIVGAVKVQLGHAFIEAITLANTPVVLPVSAHVEETFKMWDLFGEETGNIIMFIRLSCFGASVFTKFSSQPPPELTAALIGAPREERGTYRLCPLLTAEENLTVTTRDTLDDRENAFRTPVAWRKGNIDEASPKPECSPRPQLSKKEPERKPPPSHSYGAGGGPGDEMTCCCPPALPRLLCPGPPPCPPPGNFLPCECAQILMAIKGQLADAQAKQADPRKPKRSNGDKESNRTMPTADDTDNVFPESTTAARSQNSAPSKPTPPKQDYEDPSKGKSRSNKYENEPLYEEEPVPSTSTNRKNAPKSRSGNGDVPSSAESEKLVAPVPIELPPLPVAIVECPVAVKRAEDDVIPTSEVCGMQTKKPVQGMTVQESPVTVRAGVVSGGGGGDGPTVVEAAAARDDQQHPAKSRKMRNIYEYTAGMYPGTHAGHKFCVSSFRFVPKSMGWLWNCPSPDDVFHPKRGWRPGAINKQVAELIRAWRKAAGLEVVSIATVSPSTGRKRKKRGPEGPQTTEEENLCPENEAKLEVEKVEPVKPTLHVHKKDGFYYVSMFPTRTGPEDDDAPSPRPIQFKIDTKRGTANDSSVEGKSGSESDSDSDSSDSSSSSEDSMEIEFVAPAALRRRGRNPPKANMETQYNPADFLPKKEKKKGKKGKGSKGSKKGKKGKGKKGKKKK